MWLRLECWFSSLGPNISYQIPQLPPTSTSIVLGPMWYLQQADRVTTECSGGPSLHAARPNSLCGVTGPVQVLAPSLCLFLSQLVPSWRAWFIFHAVAHPRLLLPQPRSSLFQMFLPADVEKRDSWSYAEASLQMPDGNTGTCLCKKDPETEINVGSDGGSWHLLLRSLTLHTDANVSEFTANQDIFKSLCC